MTKNCEANANSGACNKAATRGNMWRYCCADCLKGRYVDDISIGLIYIFISNLQCVLESTILS